MTNPISAYILAGGQSKRMGEDKGMISLHDKPIVSYIIEEIKKITDDITIITANEKYRQFNLKTVEDIYQDRGPAGGIDTALQDAKNDLVFITSCDMPFVNEKSVSILMEQCTGREITLVKNENYIEPMFAVYAKKCKDNWRELLLNGTLKLSDYFSHFDTNFVNADEFLNSNPYLFLNINTPQDLLKAAIWMKK